MTTESIILKSLEETERLGELLGQIAIEGDIYCLDGDLGAGKTTLTQSIARGLDVPASYYVTSPSYNIFHEYPGRIPLYHMDFYRLDSEQEIIDTGLEEYFYLSGLTVVEWCCKAENLLPKSRLSLQLQMDISDKRVVLFEYKDIHWGERIHLLVQNFSKPS